MISFDKTAVDAARLSPLSLAFVGDTVFDLLVREQTVREADRPVGSLHQAATARVCAPSQARAAKAIMPLLSEQESDIYRRGRNAHTGNVPKHASSADYHSATGLEALFGWLYLNGKTDRLNYLFEYICAHEGDCCDEKED